EDGHQLDPADAARLRVRREVAPPAVTAQHAGQVPAARPATAGTHQQRTGRADREAGDCAHETFPPIDRAAVRGAEARCAAVATFAVVQPSQASAGGTGPLAGPPGRLPGGRG